MTDSAKITVGLGRDIQDLVRSAKQSPEFRPKIQPGLAPGGGSAMPFMLLEPLTSGGTARAALLRSEPGSQKYLLTAYGLDDIEAEFQVSWNDEVIDEISIFATPLELLTKLGEFTFINPDDVFVQFGNISRPVNSRGDLEEFSTLRWIIKVRPGLDNIGAPVATITTGAQSWMGVEPTEIQDSYQDISVRSLIPVGVDVNNATPMQSGAIGIASPLGDFGWVIHAIEARQLTGDFFEVLAEEY